MNDQIANLNEEVRLLKNQIYELNSKLSYIIDMVHTESTDKIKDTQLAVAELGNIIANE